MEIVQVGSDRGAEGRQKGIGVFKWNPDCQETGRDSGEGAGSWEGVCDDSIALYQ